MQPAWVAVGTLLAVQAPDSAPPARYDNALASFSDSLAAVEAAVAAFPQDLGTASPELVLARARRLQLHCGGARQAGRALATQLVAPGSSAPPRAAERRAQRDLASLELVLATCERDYDVRSPATNPDTLKAWGPFRLGQLAANLRRSAASVRALQRRPPAR